MGAACHGGATPGSGATIRDRDPYDSGIDAHVSRLESAALATAGVGAAAVAASTVSVGLPCPFLAVTGVPCPACGMTRVARTVASGDVAMAVSTDPAGVVVVLVLGALAVLALARRIDRRPDLARLRPRWVVAVLVAATGVHWATTLTFGGFVDA